MTALGDVRDAAVHGSYCPKMCTFACPVTAATGREDAKPWGLHVTVAALAEGRRPLDAAAYRDLHGCTGCTACKVPCIWDLDVPREVTAARSAVVEAGGAPALLGDVAARAAAGGTPYGDELPELPPARTAPSVAVLAGCRDGSATLAALDRLLERAGVRASFHAPAGCCGALLADLGDLATAAALRERLDLPEGVPVVVVDPHCRWAVPDATDLVTFLAGLGLARVEEPVVWHDPCVLARGAGVVGAARRLLLVVEPEHAGTRTSCSGAGLGFDLLAPEDAAAVAARRAEELAAPGLPVVTACPRARRLLAAAGVDVTDLPTWMEASRW